MKECSFQYIFVRKVTKEDKKLQSIGKGTKIEYLNMFWNDGTMFFMQYFVKT